MASSQSTVAISTATSPNDLEAVPQLVNQITESLQVFQADQNSSNARYDLLLKARTLVQSLETPRETMIKHVWAQPGASAAILTCTDFGLWKMMAKNGDGPQKVADLAPELGVDPLLLSRLMRHVAAMGYLKETGEDEYQPTNFSKALSIPIIGNGYYIHIAALSGGMARLHDFVRQTGWQNPTDATKTSNMNAIGTDKDVFALFQSLGYDSYFADLMAGYRQGRLPWMHPAFFPVKERLLEGADQNPDAALLVDIGGNRGHDLLEFHEYHPDARGKLILQDLPNVVSLSEGIDSAVTRMPYDFFTEQPVKGARAYYMHSVLHDWPDEKCKEILAQVTKAMKRGYSKLLINENVIPGTGAYWEASALDMIMLANFSSRERTESDWHRVLEDLGGLKIVKIWDGGKGVESLIECELP